MGDTPDSSAAPTVRQPARRQPDAATNEHSGNAVDTLIATRSAVVGTGLSAMIGQVPRLALVGITDSTAGAWVFLRERAPSVLLIDTELAAADTGRPALVEAGRVRTLLLGRHRHVGTLALPHLERSCGCLKLRANTAEVLDALQIIANCERPQASPRQCSACPLRRSLRAPELPLTPRERQVFDLISHGHANQAIARQMRLSVKTVESYREDIKHKLELPNAASLVKAAVLWGIGEFPPDDEPPSPDVEPAAAPPVTR